MKTTLILTGVILLLGLIIFLLAKVLKKKIAQLKEYKKNIESLKSYIDDLAVFNSKTKEVLKNKDKTTQEIVNAKTDAEVENIINTIIANNNKRVQNNTAK